MIVHLRFGYPPLNNLSKNYKTGELLCGMSCVQGVKVGNEYRILMPVIRAGAGSGSLSNALSSLEWIMGRPCWLVHGTHCGTGPDGEDLLRNPVFMQRVAVAGVTSTSDNHAAWLPQERGAEFTDVLLPVYHNIVPILSELGVPDGEWAPHKLLDLLIRVRGNQEHCVYQQLWALRYTIQSALRRLREAGVVDTVTHKYFDASYTFDKFCHAYGLL